MNNGGQTGEAGPPQDDPLWVEIMLSSLDPFDNRAIVFKLLCHIQAVSRRPICNISIDGVHIYFNIQFDITHVSMSLLIICIFKRINKSSPESPHRR